jgi:hypothetical protein
VLENRYANQLATVPGAQIPMPLGGEIRQIKAYELDDAQHRFT